MIMRVSGGWYLMKARNVPAVKCPQCKKEAPVVHFGNGYIAVCCGKIIYRGDRPPEQKDEKED